MFIVYIYNIHRSEIITSDYVGYLLRTIYIHWKRISHTISGDKNCFPTIIRSFKINSKAKCYNRIIVLLFEAFSGFILLYCIYVSHIKISADK